MQKIAGKSWQAADVQLNVKKHNLWGSQRIYLILNSAHPIFTIIQYVH